MEVLRLKGHGLNHDDIAAYADVSRRTVQRTLDPDLDAGPPRLRRCRWPQPQTAMAEHRGALEETFIEHRVGLARPSRRLRTSRPGLPGSPTKSRPEGAGHFLRYPQEDYVCTPSTPSILIRLIRDLDSSAFLAPEVSAQTEEKGRRRA
jgi:hypothetical protein